MTMNEPTMASKLTESVEQDNKKTKDKSIKNERIFCLHRKHVQELRWPKSDSRSVPWQATTTKKRANINYLISHRYHQWVYLHFLGYLLKQRYRFLPWIVPLLDKKLQHCWLLRQQSSNIFENKKERYWWWDYLSLYCALWRVLEVVTERKVTRKVDVWGEQPSTLLLQEIVVCLVNYGSYMASQSIQVKMQKHHSKRYEAETESRDALQYYYYVRTGINKIYYHSHKNNFEIVYESRVCK